MSRTLPPGILVGVALSLSLAGSLSLSRVAHGAGRLSDDPQAPTPSPAGPVPPPAPDEEGNTGPPQVDLQELSEAPPPPGSINIQSPGLPPQPAPGKGRLLLNISGNRRWCTFPDDRVVRPPAPPSPPSARKTGPRNPVYTFGYQFSIAAVERSHPGTTLLLFESPVVRTAVLRPAYKLGRGTPKPPSGPNIGALPEHVAVDMRAEQPSTPVPLWQEAYRCTTLPDVMEFDLDPGVYDLYAAFDVLLRSGNWTHRTTGYETDVSVETGRVTPQAMEAGMSPAGRRSLEFGAPAAPMPASGAGGR